MLYVIRHDHHIIVINSLHIIKIVLSSCWTYIYAFIHFKKIFFTGETAVSRWKTAEIQGSSRCWSCKKGSVFGEAKRGMAQAQVTRKSENSGTDEWERKEKQEVLLEESTTEKQGEKEQTWEHRNTTFQSRQFSYSSASGNKVDTHYARQMQVFVFSNFLI